MKSFLLCLFSFYSYESICQTYPQWGNLIPGKYSIGYKTIITPDYTRTYGSGPRIIQMYVWYPTSERQKSTIRYEQYFRDVVNDRGTDKKLSDSLGKMLITEFKSGALNPSFPGKTTEESFQEILNTPIPIIPGAGPAAEKFPLVLHISSNGVLAQSVMLEYLASHGYAVISISMYGSSPAFYGRGEDGAKGLYVMTEDLALAIAKSRTFPYVDTSKTAVIGMMAQAGIYLQMKEGLLDAVACLDCYTDQVMLKSMSHYEPKKVRIKMLQILNTNFLSEENFMMDSLVFAERYQAKIEGLQHPDFYPFPRISKPADAKKYVNHELVLSNCLQFLQYAFGEKTSYTGSSITLKKYDIQPAVPTEAEFLEWLRYGQMEQVRKAWKQYGKILAGQENFFSTVLFLARDKSKSAKEAYEMYSSVYPDDPRLKMITQFF